jgi:hypothetical protein
LIALLDFGFADSNTRSILCTLLSLLKKVLGDAFFNAHYAAFDFVNNRVGFAHLAENSETICADDWEVDITNMGQPMPPATAAVPPPPPPAPVPEQPQPVPPTATEPEQPYDGDAKSGGGGILPEGSRPQPPQPSPWSSAQSLPGYKSPASPSSSPPSSSSSSSSNMLGVGVAFLAVGAMAMVIIVMRRRRRNARYSRAQHFNEMDMGDFGGRAREVELPGML